MGKKVKKRVITWSIILGLLFILILAFFGIIAKFTGFGILGIMSMFLESSNVFIIIYSPENTTYNFNLGDNYTINLSVAESSFNAGSWWYTLIDLKHNKTINTSVIFIPNATFSAVRWSNNLTVYANNSDTGAIYSAGVVFYVNVSNSNPIISNISRIFVCENSFLPEFTLDSFFNVSDIDEDALVVSIAPQNPFYVAALKYFNYTLTEYYIYSGVLNKDHAGGINAGSKNYSETISAADSISLDSKNVNITVIEINNAPSINNIGVQTVWSQGDNSSFNYQVLVSDTEDGDQNSGNLNFSVVFSNQTLFNISSGGVINFTANSTYLGVHSVSVCAGDLGILNPHGNISLCSQDGSSIKSCNNFTLTVTDENRAPSITSYYPVNLVFDADGYDTLYFNISEDDADGTLPDVYWYVDDVLAEYDTGGTLIDSFSYIFGCDISGAHHIEVVITDGELNDSVQWNITVTAAACPAGVAPGAGGGAGGTSVVECVPKWACEEWPQCKNLKTGIGLVNISLEYEFLIKERCNFFNWSNNFCGYQTRECKDLKFCRSNLTKPGLIRECYYTKNPICEDNILNCHDGSCEILVDCGGPCKACPTCSDGIKNQNEEETDCGGSCPACVVKEFPSIRLMLWFVYVSLVIFIILLVLIVRTYIKSRKVKERLEKEVSKRKGA